MSEAALESRDDLTPDERRLVETGDRFDLRPLLERLLEMGYTRDDILFESTPEGSSARIVKAVRFRTSPVRGAVITVNLGLLGDNTLLPSYFYYAAERSPDPDRFYDFIRFFDHRLIEGLFAALHPEASPTITDWGSVLASFFRMTVPASLSTLQWIFQLDFPEFGVRVKRWPFDAPVEGHGTLTRDSALDGTLVLGRTYSTEQDGFLVDLVTEDEVDMRGRAQADRVIERLRHRLLPRLAPFHIPLLIRLTVLSHQSFAHIDWPPPVHKTYLGYERIKDRKEDLQRPPSHTTVMYRGVTGWDAPAATVKKGVGA